MRVCSGCCVVLRWVIVSSADCDGAAPGGLNVCDLYVRVAAGDATVILSNIRTTSCRCILLNKILACRVVESLPNGVDRGHALSMSEMSER